MCGVCVCVCVCRERERGTGKRNSISSSCMRPFETSPLPFLACPLPAGCPRRPRRSSPPAASSSASSPPRRPPSPPAAERRAQAVGSALRRQGRKIVLAFCMPGPHLVVGCRSHCTHPSPELRHSWVLLSCIPSRSLSCVTAISGPWVCTLAAAGPMCRWRPRPLLPSAADYSLAMLPCKESFQVWGPQQQAQRALRSSRVHGVGKTSGQPQAGPDDGSVRQVQGWQLAKS